MRNNILNEAGTMSFISSAKPDEAKKFYSETLGLRFLSEDEYGLMFEVGKDSTLRIQKVQDLKPQPATVFGWAVANISDAVKSLSDHGVKFEQYGFPTQDDRGVCTFENGDQVAWFKDPDGNTLSVAQITNK